MIGEVNCSVISRDDLASAVVVFWRPLDNGLSSFEPFVDGEEVRWGWMEYDEDALPNGAFRVPVGLKRLGVLQQLVDELHKVYGVVAEEVRASVSKEQAVQAHLEDLQKLLFTSDWIELQRGEVRVVREDKGDADI